ncbi:hypothetical protein [Isoptericola chiayiensis]|uniref:hypothetical protein n=1 Tax=Isoptericola chiayiensis TaxID=579446 RepID=UPI00155465FA|nr:hypothetical protein [Isoptericola chiayiensis]NOW01206.1 hypothetical protein [Isoptericola chiayiensis]
MLVLAAVCWIGYRAVGASLVPGDGDPHPAGVGCVTWKGPLMVIDGPVLSNRTGHTVHVSDVDVPDAEGIRLHEIRTVSTSSDVVFGAAYDPADPGWAGTERVGPEGITIAPDVVSRLAYIVEADTAGGSYPYSLVEYRIGPLTYRATYPGANAVMPRGGPSCTPAVADRLQDARIP